MKYNERLIAIIESNNLMYQLTGTIDYRYNALKAWKLLKASNEASKAFKKLAAR